jgi:hypothetical protein
MRSARCVVRKSRRYIGAQHGLLQIGCRHRGKHLFERTTPFRFEPLANGRSASRELRVPQLRVVQRIRQRVRALVRRIARMLDLEERGIGVAHRALRIIEPSLRVRECGGARIEIHAPRGHVLRELAVRLFDVRELRLERRETRVRSRHLGLQPLLAVQRVLQPRQHLRLDHLCAAALVARELLRALQLAELRGRARERRFRVLERAAALRAQALQLREPGDELLLARVHSHVMHVELLRLACGPLATALDVVALLDCPSHALLCDARRLDRLRDVRLGALQMRPRLVRFAYEPRANALRARKRLTRLRELGATAQRSIA